SGGRAGRAWGGSSSTPASRAGRCTSSSASSRPTKCASWERSMAEAPQWARVRGDVNIRLRRGAWYEVVSLTPEQAVVDVNEQQLSVARSFLQIVPLRPQRWSVVARPADAVNLPLSWGATYARSEEHTSELQSRFDLVCRLLLEKKKP